MLLDNQILPAIARSGLALKLNPNEWEVVKASTSALTIAKISETTRLPYSTVIDIVRRLSRKGILFSFVPYCDMVGLKPIFLLFPDKPIKSVPVYTRAVYSLLGRQRYKAVSALVPVKLINDYISYFSEEPIEFISTYEIRHWTASGKLTQYNSKLGILLPREEGLEDALVESRTAVTEHEKRWVDWVDLIILYFKMRYAFTKLSDVSEMVKQDFALKPPSRQLMSYHYRTHVVSLWSYNRTLFRLNTSLVPLKLYFFGGKEGLTAARVLVQAPYMYEGLVGESSAAVLGQPPNYMEPLIHEVLNVTNADMPYGSLLVVQEKQTAWISTRVIEHYRQKGDFPLPDIESFST